MEIFVGRCATDSPSGGPSTARRGSVSIAGKFCGGASLRMTFVFLIGIAARVKSCPDTKPHRGDAERRSPFEERPSRWTIFVGPLRDQFPFAHSKRGLMAICSG
jgi:hypothetical protein